MTSDLTEAKPPPAGSNGDAEALLDTANSGSQHVAVLHVAFMALCAYMLVIVFSTTDIHPTETGRAQPKRPFPPPRRPSDATVPVPVAKPR